MKKQRAKQPTLPPVRDETIRQRVIALLAAERVTAREISIQVGIPEREVYGHLEHIRRTLHQEGREFTLVPAECLGCGFVFNKRERLTRPGRCPLCRHEHLLEPLFAIGATVEPG